MSYESVKDLKDTQFKRLIGVKKHTYYRMVEIIEEAYKEKHKKRGRKSDLLGRIWCY